MAKAVHATLQRLPGMLKPVAVHATLQRLPGMLKPVAVHATLQRIPGMLKPVAVHATLQRIPGMLKPVAVHATLQRLPGMLKPVAVHATLQRLPGMLKPVAVHATLQRLPGMLKPVAVHATLQRLPGMLKPVAKHAHIRSMSTLNFNMQPFATPRVIAGAVTTVDDHQDTSGFPRPRTMADMPGPRSLPRIGAMWQYLPGGRFYGMDLNQAIKNMNRIYGDVVREEIVPGLNVIRLYNPNDFADVYKAEGECPRRMLFGLLSHYNTVHNKGVQGLLTSQNLEWKRLRSEVQQLILQPKAVSGYATQHIDIANDFVEHIARKSGESGTVQDFLPEIYKYVTEAVGTVCFDKRLGLFEENNADGKQFIRAVGEMLTLTQKELRLLPLYRFMPTPVFSRFTSAWNFIREISDRYMQEALQDKRQNSSGQLFRRLLFSSNLTQSEISTFVSEFFAAGVDTTGHYLAFTLYALAKNPRVQEKLYNELKNIPDSDISSGTLEAAPYLRAVLKESLRVYPVSPGLGRTLEKDAVLSGYHVPAGTNVVIQYDMAGKDPRFVPNPSEFRPERWLRQLGSSSGKIDPYATLPFGFGSRSCPGRRIAGQEVGIAVAKILQRFRVSYDGGELPIKMQILNTPDEQMNFRFTGRAR